MTDTIATSARIGIRQLAGAIGAELTGVDTGRPLSDDDVAQIRQALLDHKVVFLRDQHLDYASQVAFAERLGPLTLGHPTLSSPPEQPFLEEIDSAKGVRANHWHTDVTFVDRPPAFTLLHAVVIPPVGGDTLWANTVAAYESLPGELRDLADRLRIVHTNDYDYTAVFGRAERGDDELQERRREFVSTIYETEHPAVRVHPETGERSLVLGGFARTVVGFSPQASRDLIRILQEYATRPGAHGALEVAGGRPRDLGQPRHPALRDLRLRHRAPPGRARDGGRPGAGRRRRPAQRRAAQARRPRTTGVPRNRPRSGQSDHPTRQGGNHEHFC